MSAEVADSARHGIRSFSVEDGAGSHSGSGNGGCSLALRRLGGVLTPTVSSEHDLVPMLVFCGVALPLAWHVVHGATSSSSRSDPLVLRVLLAEHRSPACLPDGRIPRRRCNQQVVGCGHRQRCPRYDSRCLTRSPCAPRRTPDKRPSTPPAVVARHAERRNAAHNTIPQTVLADRGPLSRICRRSALRVPLAIPGSSTPVPASKPTGVRMPCGRPRAGITGRRRIGARRRRQSRDDAPRRSGRSRGRCHVGRCVDPGAADEAVRRPCVGCRAVGRR